jgi:hyperosmotically inducible periplasmic protein
MNDASRTAWCGHPGSFSKASAPENQTDQLNGRKAMNYARALAFAVLAGATILTTGCAVVRGQETVGAYVDDVSITTAVKAKLVEDKTVDAGAIKVQTLNGTVQLSGFAKSNAEKAQAEYIARNTKGVRGVQNALVVRP